MLYDLSLYPLLWRSVRTYWWVIYRTINHSTMRKAASITHTAQTMIERDEEMARGLEQEKKKRKRRH